MYHGRRVGSGRHIGRRGIRGKTEWGKGVPLTLPLRCGFQRSPLLRQLQQEALLLPAQALLARHSCGRVAKGYPAGNSFLPPLDPRGIHPTTGPSTRGPPASSRPLSLLQLRHLRLSLPLPRGGPFVDVHGALRLVVPVLLGAGVCAQL